MWRCCAGGLILDDLPSLSVQTVNHHRHMQDGLSTRLNHWLRISSHKMRYDETDELWIRLKLLLPKSEDNLKETMRKQASYDSMWWVLPCHSNENKIHSPCKKCVFCVWISCTQFCLWWLQFVLCSFRYDGSSQKNSLFGWHISIKHHSVLVKSDLPFSNKPSVRWLQWQKRELQFIAHKPFCINVWWRLGIDHHTYHRQIFHGALRSQAIPLYYTIFGIG